MYTIVVLRYCKNSFAAVFLYLFLFSQSTVIAKPLDSACTVGKIQILGEKDAHGVSFSISYAITDICTSSLKSHRHESKVKK